jgi:hypothetical protein
MLEFAGVDVDVASSPGPSPWRTVWFSPRLTIRRVLAGEPRPSWTAVVALAALHQVFASLQVDPVEGTFSASRSVMPVTLGALQIVFGVLVGPFLLAFVGSWLGGEADADDIRHAVAWSYVPHASFGLLWIPILIAFGGPPAGATPAGAVQWIATLLLLVILAGVVWTVVLQVITFAEVQRFAIWRAILSMVILAMPLILLGALG